MASPYKVMFDIDDDPPIERESKGQMHIQMPPGVSARGIKWAPSGSYYICGSDNCVYKLDEDLNLELFAGQPGVEGDENGHRLTKASFSFLYYMNGILVDSPNSILIADSGSNQIREIQGDQVSIFAGTSQGFLDGPKSKCQFSRPTSITRIGDKLYVTDCDNHRIRIISPDGWVSSIGHGYRSDPFFNPEKSSAPFHSPYSICPSSIHPGHLLVTERTGMILSVCTAEKETVAFRNAKNPTHCVAYRGEEIVSAGRCISSFNSQSSLKPLSTGEYLCLCFDVNRRNGDLLAGVTAHFLILWRSYLPTADPYAQIKSVDISSLVSVSENEETEKNVERFTEIHHKASKTTFIVSKTILSIHKITKSHIKAIEATNMPKETVEAFLKLFCVSDASHFHQNHKSLAHRATFDAYDHSVMISGLLHLYHITELDPLSLAGYFIKLIGELDSDQLFDLLKSIWIEYERDDWLLERVEELMKPNWLHFMTRVTEWKDLAGHDIHRYSMIISHLHGFPNPSISPRRSDNPLLLHLKRLDQELRWHSRPFSKSYDSDIISITISGHNQYVYVERWVIESQWRWFHKALKESETVDSSKILTIDAAFPSGLMICVLRFLHTQHVDVTLLCPTEARFIATHGQQYGFLGSNQKALPPFEKFVTGVSRI